MNIGAVLQYFSIDTIIDCAYMDLIIGALSVAVWLGWIVLMLTCCKMKGLGV